MKFAICNEIFQGWNLEATCSFVAKTGYDAIEIAPFTLAKSVTEIPAQKRREIREIAKSNKLSISGIHWVLVGTEGLHLTHPEAVVRERTSDYFCDLVNFCADLESERIIIGSPKQRSLMVGVTSAQGWEWATEAFRKPVELAAERGVVLCLEPLAPSETNFINTAAEAIQFVGQFQSSNFKIILDVKAMSSENISIPTIIKNSWPNFAYFHANDANLKGPGFGEIDFVPILSALEHAGYDGYVSVEVFKFDEGPEEIARRSLETLKQAREASRSGSSNERSGR